MLRKSISCILLCLKRNYINFENLFPVYFWVWTIHKYRKSASSILFSLKTDYLESLLEVYFWVWKSRSNILESEKNASIQKVYFKYTSNFECKFVSLESLLQVYFWPRKEIQMHFKDTFKVYLKHNYY